MSQRDKIVTIFVKWVTQGDKKIAQGTLDKLKKLDKIAGGIAGRMKMVRADVMTAFVDVGTDSKKNIANIMDSMKAFGGISKEAAKSTLAINSMAKSFEDSGATAGEMQKVIGDLAKDFGVEPEKLTGWIVDYSTTMLKEFAKMEKGVSASTKAQTEQAEQLKKAFIATRKVDTTEAWQKRAKVLYDAVQNQRDIELGLNKVAKAMVKGKGAIDKDTAALFGNVSGRLKVLDLSKEMSKQVEREIKLNEKEEEALGKGDKKKKKAGMRYSWLGYRMFSMGRILQKSILKPMQDAIKIMANWESSIENAAVTMALAEYYGIDLGNTIEDVAQYFRDFAEEGQRVQVGLGSLNLLMGDMAKDIGLSDTIQNIAGALRDLWEGIKNTIGPEGFMGVVTAGLLATSALIVFGSAMFFLAPIAMAIGTSVGILMGALLAIGLVVVAALIHWKDLQKFWDKTVGPALTRLNEAFKRFGDALGVQIELWDVLKLITSPVASIFKMIMRSVEGAINVFTAFVDLLNMAIDGIKDLGKWVGNIFGHSIGKDIARDLTPAIKSMKDLNAQMGGRPGGMGGAGGMGGGPQYISIYPEISLAGATISSEVDLMQIQDATERGISEALRRRAYPRWGRR